MTEPSICVITPTIGRPTLERTLTSARLATGDSWMIMQDVKGEDVTPIWHKLRVGRPYLRLFEHPDLSGEYGNKLRDFAMMISSKDYFVFLDDDDVFAPGAIDIIKQTIEQHPNKPIIFKMVNGNGEILWRNRELSPGNVGAGMFCCPNIRERLGVWDNGAGHRSDFEFIQATVKSYGASWRQNMVWSDEIIIHCKPEVWKDEC